MDLIRNAEIRKGFASDLKRYPKIRRGKRAVGEISDFPGGKMSRRGATGRFTEGKVNDLFETVANPSRILTWREKYPDFPSGKSMDFFRRRVFPKGFATVLAGDVVVEL
jgi:hypothetical protein